MPTAPKDSRKIAAPPPASPQTSPGASRQERLAQALRDNLKKRKAQQRAREYGQRAQKRQRQGGQSQEGQRGGQNGPGDDGS